LADPVDPVTGPGSRVVYVMGYGRSGSTLLDILLSSHPRLTGVGELGLLRHWHSHDFRCSCQASVRQCAFWSGVTSRFTGHMAAAGLAPDGDYQTAVEPRSRLRALLADRIPAQATEAYRRFAEATFRAIGEAAGGSEVIVDSSKSAGLFVGRVYALSHLTGLDVRAIFLVRDGRGVLWSALKRAGTPELGGDRRSATTRGLRALASWTITNRQCLQMQERLGDRVLRVRYEDLVTAPGTELARIGRHIGVDLKEVEERIAAGATFGPGHQVSGNRLRNEATITLRADIQWQQKLPLLWRWLFRVWAGRVARRLGYS